ncbi:MAG: sulfotransferase domain-containing protein [Pseudomonadota bacterium]
MKIDDYILIIGAMKCGTTTLFDLLAQHPAIAPCRPKEPGFFAFEDRWAEGFEWYERLFSFDPAAHRFGLDASTDYTKRPFVTGVVDRLAASAPRRFKLIYLMRDPVERIESHARHVQRTRMEIGKTVSHRPDHSLDAGVSPVSLAISRYAEQLDPFRDYLDRGDLLLLTLDDLTGRQDETIARVFDFLGLEPVPVRVGHENQAGSKRRKASIWVTLRRMKSFATLVRAIVPGGLRRHLGDALSSKVTVEGRFVLTPQERDALRRDLDPDTRRLAADYGVSFPR